MKLVTQEDFHQKVMECIECDDLQASLDYIETAEHLGHDMAFEREQLHLATLEADADLKANNYTDAHKNGEII